MPNPLRFITICGVWILIAGLARAQGPAGPSAEVYPGAQQKALFDRVIENQKKTEQVMDVYERLERVENRKVATDSHTPEDTMSRVIPAGTGVDHIAVNPDGSFANLAVYRAELKKLEKALAFATENSRSQHDAMEKIAKKRKERDDLIEAARTAFIFTFMGRETRESRTLLKFRMDPNPQFKATSRTTALYTRVRGVVWIDESSSQLAKIECEVMEDISIGLFLAKVNKGSHFMQERYELVPGSWVPSFSQYDFDGRKLFSNFSIHERTFYSRYRFIGPPNEALVAIRAELSKLPQ